MTSRDADLQIIIDGARRHIASDASLVVRNAAERVFTRLDVSVGEASSVRGNGLPVCQALDSVYRSMAVDEQPLPAIGHALAGLGGRLDWWRRKGASPENQPFYDGHANAMLIGPGGIERREDVMVGVSLMAPHILYPDHNHPPEEVYLAFTDGAWWNSDMDWTEPGPGGLIYNPPGILHAMRSGDKPFLALWLLPVD